MSDETAVEQAVATIRERLSDEVIANVWAYKPDAGTSAEHKASWRRASKDDIAEALAPLLVEAAKGVYGTSLAKDLLEAALTRAEAAEARAEALQRERDESNQAAEALDAKLTALMAHDTCACSYDRPGDVCLHHSPKLLAETQRADALAAELAAIRSGQGKE